MYYGFLGELWRNLIDGGDKWELVWGDWVEKLKGTQQFNGNLRSLKNYYGYLLQAVRNPTNGQPLPFLSEDIRNAADEHLAQMKKVIAQAEGPQLPSVPPPGYKMYGGTQDPRGIRIFEVGDDGKPRVEKVVPKAAVLGENSDSKNTDYSAADFPHSSMWIYKQDERYPEWAAGATNNVIDLLKDGRTFGDILDSVAEARKKFTNNPDEKDFGVRRGMLDSLITEGKRLDFIRDLNLFDQLTGLADKKWSQDLRGRKLPVPGNYSSNYY